MPLTTHELDPTEAIEDAPTEEAAAPPTRLRSFLTRRCGLVAASILLLAATMTTSWWGYSEYRSAEDLRPKAQTQESETAAQEAANSFFALVTTYDFQSVDSYTAAVADASTGSFHDRYSTASDSVKKLLRDAQVVSTGKVVTTGVDRSRDGTVTVIAFIDQTFSNKDTPQVRTVPLRMSADLVQVGDRWLVTDMGPR